MREYSAFRQLSFRNGDEEEEGGWSEYWKLSQDELKGIAIGNNFVDMLLYTNTKKWDVYLVINIVLQAFLRSCLDHPLVNIVNWPRITTPLINHALRHFRQPGGEGGE